MIIFEPNRPEITGHIPYWLDPADPRPAKEQLNEHYMHGGGWSPFIGFKLNGDDSLTYPNDPPLTALTRARLRDELICMYRHAWVAIIQPDRSFEVCRMD